jgi:cytochrome bd ubiquinol oxidase subunit II
MPELTLADVLAVLLALSVNAYVLLGGADFGGGVWDMLAHGPRRERQREVIAHAIGPIWEANHVWLILAIVLAFTCFSPVFARLMTVLHIPVSLMLIGIVLRGSAFTFRSHDDEHDAAQRRWGRIFSSASLLTPLLLGVCIGAVASGRVVAPTRGTFAQRFIEPWLTPFALGVGVLTLALFAFLAAVFLTMETRDRQLVEDFRRQAIGAGLAVFLAAGLVLLLSFRHAPLVTEGLMGSPWALPLHLATGLSAVAVFTALWLRRFALARVLACLQVTCIFWGWTASQYPYLVPPDLTIERAAAPPVTLRLTLWALAGGTLVLAPSLFYLFRVFKSVPAAASGPASESTPR